MTRHLAPVASMPAAALAVHQLRYWLAFGNTAGLELQRQGHGYLHSLVPWVVLLLAVPVGAFLGALGRSFGGRCSRSVQAASFTAFWLTCAASLVAVYVAQELLEGLLATGHPAALVGVFGYGGWWAIPAALGVGLVLAAALHGARRVLLEVARRRGRLVAVARAAVGVAYRPRRVLRPALAPLADGSSGRGPPR